MKRDSAAIFFSFLLIFAFNSADNSIAPLVKPLSETFMVSQSQALWLISACTAGTVAGLIAGPAAILLLEPGMFLLCSLALRFPPNASSPCPILSPRRWFSGPWQEQPPAS